MSNLACVRRRLHALIVPLLFPSFTVYVLSGRLLCPHLNTCVWHRWGESAGAISVGLQMVTNGGNTEGLFRGAFMQSGSPIPVGDISHGQGDYDALVAQTGCAGAADTLQCLRHVPFETLKKAVDKSPGIFSYEVSNGWSHGLHTVLTYISMNASE